MSKIYVGYNERLNGYLKIAGHTWLRFEGWFKDPNITYQEVRDQIMFAQGLHLGKYGIFAYTDKVNEAEIWDEFAIEKYSQYYPDLVFKEVHLTVSESK